MEAKNIFLCDMFRNQVVNITFDRLFDLFDIGIFLQDLFQNRIVYFLVDAKFFLVNIYPCFLDLPLSWKELLRFSPLSESIHTVLLRSESCLRVPE